jgi:hypothetical protein
MPCLPADAVPAAEFVVRHLYRPIDVAAGSRYCAMAETAGAADDPWFWNDDNAKILELMSRPEVWRRFPQETGEILRFVRSMCRGPFVFRRVGAPLLRPLGGDGDIASFQHSLMRIRCDLGQGAVVAGLRFHDERDADNLLLGGNYVAFTYRGRRRKLPVPTGSPNRQAVCDGHLLRLRHAGEIIAAPGTRLGEISYTYAFDARSMLFEVEAALDLEPGIEVADVVLTIGHGALSYCLFNTVATDATNGAKPLYAAGLPSSRRHRAAGAAYYAIRQEHISADALAVHTLSLTPQHLAALETVVARQGQLDRVIARYEFPGRHRGGRLVAAEHKLITAGGFYDRVADYAALMRQASGTMGAQRAACDFSISYDYGATLNAFAKGFAVAAAGQAPPEADISPEELRAAFDELLSYYCELYGYRHDIRPNAIFSRELAFVVLAAATMFRATGAAEYLRRLVRLCEVLLDFELPFEDQAGGPASVFLMRRDNRDAAYFDCQSAALLALTRAAAIVEDPAFAAAIERGLAAYGLVTCALDLPEPHKLDTVAIELPGGRTAGQHHTGVWNFKAGLALRFFAALRQAPVAGLQAVAARHADRIALFEAILKRQLAKSVIERDHGMEFRTSVLSGETNSETQPWAMLGLVGHPFD